MFTDHGTYIIGFSTSKNHFSVGLEAVEIARFRDDIKRSGFDSTDYTIKIKWNQEVDYDLLERIILFSIEDKVNCKTFWR